ncbi:DsrE family protein [Candidatus Saccharibacteria bacterium TM7i]|nr:DsrE family protein [Candidatus Saccharibacteria bacterium TM7i]
MNTAKLIIDFERDGIESAERLLTHLRNLIDDLAGQPLAIEVAVYGKAISFVQQGSPYEESITQFSEEGVVFSVCRNAMNLFGITANMLQPEVVIVPSGVGRIVKAQLEGAKYYKAL